MTDRLVRWLRKWRDWTGLGGYSEAEGHHRGKTAWDWADLVLVPLILLLIAGMFTWQSARTSERSAIGRARDDSLQTYLDKMENLLLNNDLRTSAENDNVRHVARARTLTVLRQLDGPRKGEAIRFLYESGLIGHQGSTRIVALDGADLTGAYLPGAMLQVVNLSNADLSGANLSNSDLAGSDLFRANLTGANLSHAGISGTSLYSANLSGANLTGLNSDLGESAFGNDPSLRADLSQSNLTGANLTGAFLYGALFTETDFAGANLTGADLREANLSQARNLTPQQLEATVSYYGARGWPTQDRRNTPTPVSHYKRLGSSVILKLGTVVPEALSRLFPHRKVRQRR